MVALANLYTILDVSVQQLAVGLVIVPSMVALAWYVSHPAHRRQLSGRLSRPGTRVRSRGDESLAKALPPLACSEAALLLPKERGTGGEASTEIREARNDPLSSSPYVRYRDHVGDRHGVRLSARARAFPEARLRGTCPEPDQRTSDTHAGNGSPQLAA